MTPLIVMPEPLPGAGAADLEAVATHMPELPALTRLLARARQLPRTADWRSGTLAALLPAAVPVAPAAVAACAIPGLSAGSGVSMVAPLHLVAGISRVHLPPGGRIQAPLEPWRQAFNTEFGGADLQLHAAGSGWVLAAPFAHAACDPAPEVLGGPLARQPAADTDLRSLRRLGAEVELWLAAHPLNRAREQQQLPPLNTFWFWGGARAVALPAAPAAPQRIASPWPQDAWLAGLAQHLGVAVVAADDWSSLPPGAALVVLAPPADIAPAQYWQEMESRWLAPALRALERGAIAALRLQLGGSAWQLPCRSPLRWLRRARPWYQQVQA